MSSKETIYDTEIAPLMDKIIKVCKDNEISFIASAELGKGLKCTTYLNYDEDKAYTAAKDIIRNGFTAFMVKK